MQQPIGRRAVIRLVSLCVVVPILCSCGDDDPITPLPPNLDDLAVSLAVEPATPLISEAVTATIRVSGGDARTALAAARIAWGWTEEYSYLFDDLGRVEVQLQFVALGEQQVRVRIQAGQQERVLSQTVQVRAGDGDGSLEMIPVAAGPFLRGDDQSAFSLQRPQRQIQLAAFALARTEVTNATFAQAIQWAASRGLVEAGPSPRFLIWTPIAGGEPQTILDLAASDLLWDGTNASVQPGRELCPVSGARWAGATTVCNWLSEMAGLEPCYTFTPSNPLHLYTVSCDFTRDGYRLPTEAEWEKAARGGLTLMPGPNPSPDRVFPWGQPDLHLRIDLNLDGDPPYPLEMYGSLRANVAAPLNANRPFGGPIFGGSLPVGSFPGGRGPYGHDDLQGNIAEWCHDWFGYGYYTTSPDTDPRGPDAVLPSIDDFKAFRGDSWYGPFIPGLNAFSVEEGCSKRRWATYHFSASFLGFRLARSMPAP
jgi:formylglycine-generating enzyme required for sulfatase activity